ncbi:hypothetical protein [Dongia sp.]|uniref:hypothetical protein n=1 Tax=Dongia sp. TaxID=1977262 RepID=UPI003751F08E
MLSHERLRAYLAESPHNCVVLTDYLALEVARAKHLASHLKILADFPKQLIPLRPTEHNRTVVGTLDEIRTGFVDWLRVGNKGKAFTLVESAKSGDAEAISELAKIQLEAEIKHRELTTMTSTLPELFRLVTATYSSNDLRELRQTMGDGSAGSMSPSLQQQLTTNISSAAVSLFQQHWGTQPLMSQLINLFIYRFAVAANIWLLRMISLGGPLPSLETLRNDTFDVNFATYATYFDGILSDDRRLLFTYLNAKEWISRAETFDPIMHGPMEAKLIAEGRIGGIPILVPEKPRSK